MIRTTIAVFVLMTCLSAASARNRGLQGSHLKLSAKERRLLTKRARQHVKQRRFADAISVLERLFADRQRPQYLKQIAECYANRGKPFSALGRYRLYLKIEPNAHRRLVARKAIDRLKDPIFTGIRRLAAAKLYKRARMWSEAAYALMSDTRFLLTLAHCEYRLGRLRAALVLYHRLDGTFDRTSDYAATVRQRVVELERKLTKARVTITSIPSGAHVLINGVRLPGMTPVVIRLKPGRYRIRLLLRQRIAEKTVVVTGPEARLIGMALALPAQLNLISGIAGATVLINGKVVGTTPISNPLRLMPGTYRVLATLKDSLPFLKTVTLVSGERRSLVLWSRVTGRLQVKSNRDNALIYVDGRYVGITPLSEPVEVAPGEHRVALKIMGAVVFRRVITTKADQSTVLLANLPAPPPPQPVPQEDDPPRRKTVYRKRSNPMTAIWATLISGAVLAAVGSGLVVLYVEQENSNPGGSPPSSAMKWSGVAFAAAGGVLLTTCLFLYLDKPSQNRQWGIAPTVSPNSIGVHGHVRF